MNELSFQIANRDLEGEWIRKFMEYFCDFYSNLAKETSILNKLYINNNIFNSIHHINNHQIRKNNLR